MKTSFPSHTGVLALGLLLLAAASGRAQDQVVMTTSSGNMMSTEQMAHMSATVTAVDQKARTVTLKGPEGGEMTLAVSDDVKRLNEVKVGDQLDIGYLQAIDVELREATPEEMNDPLLVTEQSDKADKSRAPAGAKARMVRAVVTIEGISRWLNTITVRGPRGNYFVMSVDPSMIKWESLHIGQTMVATYTEALVMSIEHAAKPMKK